MGVEMCRHDSLLMSKKWSSAHGAALLIIASSFRSVARARAMASRQLGIELRSVQIETGTDPAAATRSTVASSPSWMRSMRSTCDAPA